MYICINHSDDPDRQNGHAYVCSDRLAPYDTWHLFTVDAVVESERIEVIIRGGEAHGNQNTERVWDDASLTVAPAPATPTPTITPLPVRSAPAPFDATALRDAMYEVMDILQKIIAMLDRVHAGGSERCETYMSWYWTLVTSPIYADVPAEWQWAHDEYVAAVEHAIEGQHDLKHVCDTGGGGLSGLTYGVSRIAVDEAMGRLGSAIDKANELFGGPPTPTPIPTATPEPVRPIPGPFDGVGLRDASLDARDNLQQMGGLLDRGGGSCQEYMGWYWDLVTSPTYADVPAEWQWTYGEYIGAVEHAVEENREIKEICDAGGGVLSTLTFGASRQSIDKAIARLGPAIDKANELLSQ